MNIIGKWKVIKVAVFDEDFNLTLKSADELAPTPENTEYLQLLSSIVDFTPEGKALAMLKIPEEALEEAKAMGMSIDADGYAVVEQREWKEENGQLLYNTGNEGEIAGEAIDPFEPLCINEDNTMLLPGGMMLLQKLD